MAIKISDITYSNLNLLTPIKGHTPFHLYENDPEFVKDSKKVVSYVAQRMGVSELTKPNLFITDLTVYAAFEEAVTTYGNKVYEFKVRDNYINLEGSSTSPFVDSSESMQSSKDINIKINWSQPINATLEDVDNDLGVKVLINNNSLFKIKAKWSEFVSPNEKYIKNYTFSTQKILPGDTYYDLSNVVLNKYNKLGVEYDDNGTIKTKYVLSSEEGYKFIEEQGNGELYLYFIILDNTIDGTDINKFPEGIETIYKQKIGESLNDKLLNGNLGSVINISDAYGQEAGVGGKITPQKGKLEVKQGQQVYDLDKWAIENGILKNIGDKLEILKIFHDGPPAIVRFFDPFAGTGMGMQNLNESFGFGKDSPASQFFMFPINFDVQKIQHIELNDEIRRSGYSFNIRNNKLELFPIPTYDYNLWFEYTTKSAKDDILNNQNGDVVTDIMNIPFRNPIYSNINSIGRQWIFKYTLALCKETEGHVRLQHNNLQLPKVGTPNGSDLLSDAREEKKMLLDNLKETLESVSKKSQLERKADESEKLKSTLENIPTMIYIG